MNFGGQVKLQAPQSLHRLPPGLHEVQRLLNSPEHQADMAALRSTPGAPGEQDTFIVNPDGTIPMGQTLLVEEPLNNITIVDKVLNATGMARPINAAGSAVSRTIPGALAGLNGTFNASRSSDHDPNYNVFDEPELQQAVKQGTLNPSQFMDVENHDQYMARQREISIDQAHDGLTDGHPIASSVGRLLGWALLGFLILWPARFLIWLR